MCFRSGRFDLGNEEAQAIESTKLRETNHVYSHTALTYATNTRKKHRQIVQRRADGIDFAFETPRRHDVLEQTDPKRDCQQHGK